MAASSTPHPLNPKPHPHALLPLPIPIPKTLKSLFSSFPSSSSDHISKFRSAISSSTTTSPSPSPPRRRRPKTLTDHTKPSLHFLNSLLNSHILSNRPSDAHSVLDLILSLGQVPTNHTHSLLLKLFFLSHLDPVPAVFDYLFSILHSGGPHPDPALFSTLISLLCRSSHLDEALGLLSCMEDEFKCPPTVRCYTSLVLEYCNQSKLKEAAKLVDEMPSRGCPPDNITYTILVDGLCKHGKFKDAEGFIRERQERMEAGCGYL